MAKRTGTNPLTTLCCSDGSGRSGGDQINLDAGSGGLIRPAGQHATTKEGAAPS